MPIMYMRFWSLFNVVRDDWQGQEIFLLFIEEVVWMLYSIQTTSGTPLQWVLVAPVGPDEPKLKVLNKFENTGLLY
jgi:hypothetical protein